MSYQPIIDRSYLTEIKLVNAPGAGQKVPFIDIPMLRGVYSIGVECFYSPQLTISPNSNTVVALVTGMVLTLTVNTTEEVFQFPCFDLVPGNNSGLIRMLHNKVINLPKSYITILDVTGLNQNESVLFNFIYRKVLPKRK